MSDTVRKVIIRPSSALELCDRMGFYVIDEADLETHGAFFMDETNCIFRNILPLFRLKSVKTYSFSCIKKQINTQKRQQLKKVAAAVKLFYIGYTPTFIIELFIFRKSSFYSFAKRLLFLS